MSKPRQIYGLELLRDTLVVREATRKTMTANRAKDTGPERLLRSALWAAGVRGYRKHLSQLPGKPDIVFNKVKVCVFVHGCFWHGCKRCGRSWTGTTNRTYWTEKIARNVQRDKEARRALRASGYEVIVVWECDLKRELQSNVAAIRCAITGHKHKHE